MYKLIFAIQQGWIKLIKSYSKEKFINVTKKKKLSRFSQRY